MINYFQFWFLQLILFLKGVFYLSLWIKHILLFKLELSPDQVQNIFLWLGFGKKWKKTLECEMKIVERSMTRFKTMIKLDHFMNKPYFIYNTARRPEEQRREIINRTPVFAGVILNKIYFNLKKLLLLYGGKR